MDTDELVKKLKDDMLERATPKCWACGLYTELDPMKMYGPLICADCQGKRDMKVVKMNDWINQEAEPNGIGAICKHCHLIIDFHPVDHAEDCREYIPLCSCGPRDPG